jgi:UDP-N-acetylglucosamine 2-epimerase (non-hydrolysing)
VKIMTIVGTRPELIRLSLTFERFAAAGVDHHLVHTGQNYDPRLSDIFFEELGLPTPDSFLGIRSEQVGHQIGEIIARSEDELQAFRPDALLVLGDTNSALSAIAAVRNGIPVFHMEAGNRCYDRRVPEERNRTLIDHISDWLLPYTPRSREYLLAEGIPPQRILVSGNPIRDILDHFRPLWEGSDVLTRLGHEPDGYVLVTAHRQETVDIPDRLRAIVQGLNGVAERLDLPLVFSVHPRTRGKLSALGVPLDDRIELHEPFSFGDFVKLESGARCVISDSGTVQEECSLLHVPTVTCRNTTERPETVECGSNVLSGTSEAERMVECVEVMVGGSTDWVSPYEGPEHHGVADRVLKLIAGSLAAG